MSLDRTVAPVVRRIEEFSIPSPLCHTLKNGIPLYIIQAGNEDVIRLDILVRGGALDQSQPLQAMFANRMLREGTKQYSSQVIAERLDYYGAWLDLSSSANYGFITLYSLGKYFSQTINILASLLKEPTFPDKQLSVVREINRQQFRVNSQRVEVMAHRRLQTALFGDSHPLGIFAVEEDYDRLNRQALETFYSTHYHSANCSIYVSGRVTDGIIRLIEEHFGNELWGEYHQSATSSSYDIITEKNHRIFIEKEDALQSSLKMGCISLPQSHPDYLQFRVLVTLFGGYFGSRLMANIREDKGYTYGIGAALVSYPGCGVFCISTEAANEYIDPLIREVYTEMDRLCQDLVSETELDMVRSYMMGELCRSYENALSISDAWIYIETSGLDAGFFSRSLQAVQDVSVYDIQNLAHKYFCKENLIAVIAGKKM